MIFLMRETLISLHIFFQLGQQGPAHGLTLLLLSGTVYIWRSLYLMPNMAPSLIF